jgi:FkbM family methyltransferase
MRKVFIDGGARIGETVEMFLNTRPDLKGCDVYFFECNNDHLDVLNNIRETNQDYNFIIKNEAIWIEDGESDFYISIDRWGDAGCTLDPSKREKLDMENPKRVKTINFSNFINQFSDDDHIIVKLDIEGAEYKVVNDLLNSGVITKIKELHVEWHDHFFDENSQPLKNQLSKIDIIVNNHWT